MLLLFQCRKCGKFFCRSKHYTASVSNICFVKIIAPCNINRQRILMIPCFIFYRNSELCVPGSYYAQKNRIAYLQASLSFLLFHMLHRQDFTPNGCIGSSKLKPPALQGVSPRSYRIRIFSENLQYSIKPSSLPLLLLSAGFSEF